MTINSSLKKEVAQLVLYPERGYCATVDIIGGDVSSARVEMVAPTLRENGRSGQNHFVRLVTIKFYSPFSVADPSLVILRCIRMSNAHLEF